MDREVLTLSHEVGPRDGGVAARDRDPVRIGLGERAQAVDERENPHVGEEYALTVTLQEVVGADGWAPEARAYGGST